MKTLPIPMVVLSIVCGLACAGDPVALPKGVPPVIGTAIASDSPTVRDGDYEQWTIQVMVPKITWDIVGEERPKREWPELTVNVQEAVLTLSMSYHPATQLADNSQNRIVDLKGRRLNRAEAIKLLEAETPVLVSVSGEMPNPFYLQCTRTDALIVILGLPDCPAPQLLPQPQKTTTTPASPQKGRTTGMHGSRDKVARDGEPLAAAP